MDKRLRYLNKRPKKLIKAGSPKTERVSATLDGPYDLERFSFELQKLLARLQELGAQGVGNCSIYFTPLNGNGEIIALKDEQGRTAELIRNPSLKEDKIGLMSDCFEYPNTVVSQGLHPWKK